ncbi:MAG: helix-turn-helix domain-containing protein [Candidatus Azobacteroides sp.]|nr:helix-turn-helix domain-containing protein [Candidatus Azobacteroides sp.]
MVERIQQIIDYERLKPGEFAEQIGINRSAISHILNKRNKPSLDVIHRILTRYNYIETDWLLFGKGNMFKNNEDSSSGSSSPITPTQYTLFDPINKNGQQKEIKEEKEAFAEKVQSDISPLGVKEIPVPVVKKISKLVIFYTDNTFDTFTPDNSSFE